MVSALPLTIGSRLNVQTGGTAIDPEVPITTCPDGEDDATAARFHAGAEVAAEPHRRLQIDREEGVFVRARLSHADLRRFAAFLVLEEDGASQEAQR